MYMSKKLKINRTQISFSISEENIPVPLFAKTRRYFYLAD